MNKFLKTVLINIVFVFVFLVALIVFFGGTYTVGKFVIEWIMFVIIFTIFDYIWDFLVEIIREKFKKDQ